MSASGASPTGVGGCLACGTPGFVDRDSLCRDCTRLADEWLELEPAPVEVAIVDVDGEPAQILPALPELSNSIATAVDPMRGVWLLPLPRWAADQLAVVGFVQLGAYRLQPVGVS